MKQFLFTFFCLLIVSESLAQSGFYKQIFDVPNEQDDGHLHVGTFDGGTVSLTHQVDNINGLNYNTVIKADAAGNIQWTKHFGPGSSYPCQIAQCYDSGYVFCYAEYSAAVRTVVIRLDQNGNVVYSRRISVPSTFLMLNQSFLVPRPNGNIFLGGTIFDNIYSVYIWYFSELDATGSMLWSHGYNRNASKNTLHDVDTMSNGDIMLLGSSFDPVTLQYRTLITRITTTGLVVWGKEYASAGYDRFGITLVRMPGDFLHVASFTYQPAIGIGEINLMRIDGAGNELWTFRYSITNISLNTIAIQMGGPQSTVLVGGYTNGGFILKNDSSGLMLAERAYPVSSVQSMDTLANGDYTFASWNTGNYLTELFTTNQQGLGCNDSAFSLTKTPETSTVLPKVDDTLAPLLDSVFSIPTPPVTVNVIENCMTDGIAAYEEFQACIYPVPATDHFTVTSGYLIHSVEIISTDGKTVKSVNTFSRSTAINVSDLPNGMYFVRLRCEEGVTVKPINIAR